MTTLLTYLLRPAGTSLWVPQALAQKLQVCEGQRLTEAQYKSAPVQELLVKQRAAQDNRAGEARLAL